jgi:hypothetical protein
MPRRRKLHTHSSYVSLLLSIVASLIAVFALRTPLAIKPATLSSDKELSAIAGSHVIAMGIQWSDAGSTKFTWIGTGFSMGDGTWCGTAGHVLQELVSEANDFEKRGVRPAIVGYFPDGSTRELVELEIYPGLPDPPNSLPGHFDIDLGRFRTDPPWSDKGLIVADPSNTYAGEIVTTAGYPSELTSPVVIYPNTPSRALPLLPLVKFGRLERLTGLNVADSTQRVLLQHDLALVGGFSGSPLIDQQGALVGVVIWSQQAHLPSLSVTSPTPLSKGAMRDVDAGGFNFAVSSEYFAHWGS